MRRLLVCVAMVFAVAALAASAALADSCANVSRAAPACGTTCTDGPIIQGNWVWLPSIGVPLAAWGFITPGSELAAEAGTPGAGGNYTNGKTESLLGVSAVCVGKGNAQNARQQDHGIQSGCE
ncbi:MAG: hypothetical protein QOF27_2118 [Gaiellaceae bacterium]|jgi:hypothetical protein|nr:hypothetical protein [Gaiellaceae bacterium]